MKYFIVLIRIMIVVGLVLQQITIAKQDSDIKRLEILYLSALENCK